MNISKNFAHHINTVLNISASTSSSSQSRTELDSHADSPVVGKNAIILYKTDMTVNVTPFSDDFGMMPEVPVVHAAVAYDCPVTGLTSILIINNALYIAEMEHNLLPPIMMRLNGIMVDECPKFLSPNPTVDSHSIFFPTEKVRFPLELNGTTSFIPTRRPKGLQEVNQYNNLTLTSEHPDWDPSSHIFSHQEKAMTNWKGEIKTRSKPDRKVLSINIPLPPRPPINPPIPPDQNKNDHFTSSLLSKVNIGSISSSKRNGIKPEVLAEKWDIGLATAKRTTNVTTQRGVRTVEQPSMQRRFRTNDRQLRYRRLNTTMFTDTYFSSVKSSRGNTCAQIWTNDIEWIRVDPMSTKSNAHHSAKKLFKNDGVPSKIVMDGAREQVLGKFKDACNDATVLVQQLEYNTPWANRAEGAVRENKRAVRRAMKKSDCPAKLWDYCAELQAKIRCHTAHDIPTLNGQVPETVVTGNTADISELVEFGWYEWIYYRDATGSFPLPEEELGRYLGPSENVGSKMSMWSLKGNGKVVSRTTLRTLSESELASETEKEKRKVFTIAVNQKLGMSLHDIGVESDSGDFFDDGETPSFSPYIDLEGIEEPTMPEADSIEDYDKFIESEVLLPKNGVEMSSAKVVSRSKDKHGKVKGTYNKNPILDTRVYDVMFPDGATCQYAANVIAESMYSQVDSNGHHTLLLKEITDHRKSNTAIHIDDKFIISKTGRKSLRKTTKGWDFLCLWKDGSSTWAPLKDLKESNPVDIAEYVVGNRISEEAAFAWWVPYTLKKRDHIISKVKARFLKKSHKFGVEVPNSVQGAYDLDMKNDNTFWRDAIHKEMTNVAVAFHILEHGENESVGYMHT